MTAHPPPERLGAYLDDELDAAARAGVDTHLRECAECGAHLADLVAVDEAARRVPLVVPEGYFDDFAPRVRARLDKRAPVRWRPPVWGWAAAAALLLAVITPLALQQRRASGPLASTEDAPAGLREEGRFKQNNAPAAAPTPAVPAATLVAPGGAADRLQVPPPPPAPAQESDVSAAKRSLDARLARRDQPAPSFAGRKEATEEGRVAGATGAGAPPEAQPKPEAPAPAPGVLADGKLEKEKSDEANDRQRALGYVGPPAATAQRPHGPRSQNTPQARGGDESRKSAAESKDKEQGFAAAVTGKARPADADAAASTMQESVDVSPRSRALGPGLVSARFRSLAESEPPRSDGEARRLREAWRAFASEHPEHPQADEARVRVIETGVLAYTLGRRPQDLEIAERDARAYLERRPEAPQGARVRAALRKVAP